MNIRIPPVGTPVVYYPNAEPDNPPVAAVVVKISPNGVASLFLMDPMGGHGYKQSIHHVSSPFLRDDGTGMLTPGALRSGAWDFHPWMMNVLGDLDSVDIDDEDEVNFSSSTVRAVNKPKTKEEKRAKCREYIRGGLSLDTVCNKVRSLGFSRRDVQQMFAEEGKAPVAELAAASS